MMTIEERPKRKRRRKSDLGEPLKYKTGTTELFLKRLEKVCDGSVYTEDRLRKIFGIGKTNVRTFVYMCDVYPGVKVNRVLPPRLAGKIGECKCQYQFVRVHPRVDPIREEALDVLQQAVHGAPESETGQVWLIRAVEVLNKAKGA